MFSVFGRDSRLLILPISPLTLIDAIVISLFFLVLGLFLFGFNPELLLLCFGSWSSVSMLVDTWFVSVHVICCSWGGLGVGSHSLFVFFSWAGLGGAARYGYWSRLLIRFGLAFSRAGVLHDWKAAFWQDL